MGRGDGDREVVSDEDWAAFLADTITPRFPDGLSVIDVAGQGTTADGSLERERTKMLLVLVPPTDETSAQSNERDRRRVQAKVQPELGPSGDHPSLRGIQVIELISSSNPALSVERVRAPQ